MRIVLFEATPRNPGVGTVTIRASTAQGDPAGIYLNGQQWLPAIARAPTLSLNLLSLSVTGQLEVAYSDMELRLGEALGNNDWSRFVWDGAPCQLWVGELGQSFGSFVSVLKGRCGPMQRPQAPTGTLSLRGPEGDLDKPVLTLSYAGTGGMEGDAGMKGVLRPWCSGFCEAVSGVLINRAKWIWQVHGYGAVQAITAAYEQGIDLGPSVNNFASYAALRDATLAEGEWATCHLHGLVRLGAQPTGRVVFDVQGARDGASYYDRAPQIAGHIMRHVGVPAGQISAASISAAVAAFDYPYGVYIDSQTQAMAVVTKAMADTYGYALADGLGVWRFGRFATGKTPTALRKDRSAFPLVQQVSQEASASPVGRVAVGSRRCWTPHNESEISPALLDLINGVATLQQARPWLVGDTQEVGQLVTFEGRTFQAAITSIGVQPPSTGTSSAAWTLIADKGADGAAGAAGPAIILATPAGQSFTFTDGRADPLSQTLTFSIVRQNAGSSAAVWTTTPSVPLGGAGDTRTLSVSDFGSNRQVVVRAAVDSVFDETVVVRLERTASIAGVPVEQLGGNLQGEFLESWAGYPDLAAVQAGWEISHPIGGGVVSLQTNQDMAAGVGLRVSGYTHLKSRRRLPFSPEDLYEVEVRAFIDSAGQGVGNFFLAGVTVYDASGVELQGTPNGTYHYFAAANPNWDDGFRTFTGYFRGRGSSVDSLVGGLRPNPSEPGKVLYPAVTVAALVLLNSGGSGGVTTVDYVRIRKVEDLTPLPSRPWVVSDFQQRGQVVTFGGRSWIARVENTGVQPPSSATGTATWALLADKGADGADGAAGATGASTRQIFQRTTAPGGPSTPAASAGVPSGWSENSNPSGTGPVWSSVGARPEGGSIYTWGAPFRSEAITAAQTGQFVPLGWATSGVLSFVLPAGASRQVTAQLWSGVPTAPTGSGTMRVDIEHRINGGSWMTTTGPTQSYNVSEPFEYETGMTITNTESAAVSVEVRATGIRSATTTGSLRVNESFLVI